MPTDPSKIDWNNVTVLGSDTMKGPEITPPKPEPISSPAQTGGIPESYYRSIRAAESGGNDAAKNPKSSATGRYQFTKGTWRNLMRNNPHLGLTPNGRLDPAQQERAIRVFTQNNANQLNRSGIAIDGGSLYAAHFLGAGGAIKAYRAPDDRPMVEVVGSKVVNANPFLKKMTAGSFRSWAAGKGSGGGATFVASADGSDDDYSSLQGDIEGVGGDHIAMMQASGDNLTSVEWEGVPVVQADGSISRPQSTTTAHLQPGTETEEDDELQSQFQELEAEAPGRYLIIPQDQYDAWKTEWDAQNQSTGIVGDTTRLLQSGWAGLGLAAREAVGAIPVVGDSIVSGLDTVDEWMNGQKSEALLGGQIDKAISTLTPGTRQAREKQWWDSEKNRPGSAWADPRSYFAGIVESLPGTIATMGPSMALARGAYVSAVARGAGEKAAAAAAARTALIAGGVSEGILGGGQAAYSVREQIAQMPRQALEQSEAVQQLMQQSGMTLDEAVATLTEDAATQAFVIAGAATGVFGGFGDRVLAKILSEGVGGNIAQRIVKGAAREGFAEGILEEAPQEAGSQAGQNIALKNTVDPDREITEGVANAAAGGLAVGGAMGGGMGAAGGVASPAPSQSDAPGPQAPVDEQVIADRTPRKGSLSEAVDHAQRATAEAAGAAFFINDPAIAGMPAGELNGVEVNVAPDQDGVPDGMRRVVLPNGQTHIVGARLLVPKQLSATTEDEATTASPIEPSTVPDGAPNVGTDVRIKIDGAEPFMARIEGYEEGEAVVMDVGTGELLQVPMDAMELAPAVEESIPDPVREELPEDLPGSEPIPAETTVSDLPPENETGSLAEVPYRAPEPGQRVIVDAEGVERFSGKVQSYEENDDEVLVRKDDGTELQVPRDALRVSKLTEDQIEDKELKETPPVERETITNTEPGAREVLGKQVVLPDEAHARLFDLGKLRRDSKRTLGAGALDLDSVSAGEQERLAEIFGVPSHNLGQMADDYRYRVENAAKKSKTRTPVKMWKVNSTVLDRMREGADDAATKNEPAIVDTPDAGTSTLPQDWDSLPTEARKAVLQAANVKRAPSTRWADFPANIRKKLEASQQVSTEDTAVPETPSGTVRVYHSGSKGEGQTGRWVSTDRTYARNYRRDLPLFFLDLPATDPRVNNASWPDQGVEQGFTFNFELTPEEASRLQQVDRGNAEVDRGAARGSLDAAAQEAATSPHNDLPEPTQAQKEAGNYRKGHVSLGGFSIAIENPKGSQRKGVDRNGNAWSITMKSHYGYFKGTLGRDKDHIDTFIRPGTKTLSDNDPVFVIDQVDPSTGKFDEHKIMLGFQKKTQAERAYKANYDKGWKGLGTNTQTTVGDLKKWFADGDTKKSFARPEKPKSEKASPGTGAYPDSKGTGLSADEVKAVLRSKEWKKVFGSTTNIRAETKHYAHPESGVAYDQAAGWLDAKNGKPPRKPKPFTPVHSTGFNPIDAYMEAYWGAKTGEARSIRSSESVDVFNQLTDPKAPPPTNGQKKRQPANSKRERAKEILQADSGDLVKVVDSGLELQSGSTFEIVGIDDKGSVELTVKGGLPAKWSLKELEAEVREGARFERVTGHPPKLSRNTKTKAFNDWFGASKVVDNNGEPLRVFHGTTAEFEGFDRAALTSAFGKLDDSQLGFFFTDNPRAAGVFAQGAQPRRGTSGTVIPAYLSIQNPFVVSLADDTAVKIEGRPKYTQLSVFEAITKALPGQIGDGFNRQPEKVVAALKEQGYDGIHVVDSGFGKVTPAIERNAGGKVVAWDVWIALNPEQIKSVNNKGTFDPTDPNLLLSQSARGKAESYLNRDQLKDELKAGPMSSLIDPLMRNGALQIIDKVPEGLPDDTQAFTDADGNITLVSGQISKGEGTAVLLHEAFHAGRNALFNRPVWRKIENRLGNLYHQFETSAGAAGKFFEAAKQSVDRTDADGALAIEEFGAYAIEAYETSPLTVKRWAQDAIGVVKAWMLKRFGRQLGKVTPSQLRALAVAALKDRAAGSTPVSGSGSSRLEKRLSRRFDKAAVKEQLGGRWTDLTPSLLSLVPLNYFQELKRPGMRSIDQYLRIKRAMDSYRGEKHEAMDEIAQKWRKFSSRNRKGANELASIMHDATLAGIDPAVDYGNLEPPKGYIRLRARFDALPPAARGLYKTVRNSYVKIQSEMDKLILDNVKKAQEINEKEAKKRYDASKEKVERDPALDELERREKLESLAAKHKADLTKSRYAAKARMTRLRQTFEKNRVPAPYFPLARFGDYFISVRDMAGDVVSFTRFESDADRRRWLRENKAKIEQEYPGVVFERGVLSNAGDIRQAMDPRMVAEIDGILKDANVDQEVMDAIYQKWLQSMPDLSVRKRYIHRKGTRGFHQDALRAFASHMFHAGHQLGKLKYGLDLQEAVGEARDQARNTDDPTRAGQLVNELTRRHDWVMNPKGSKLAQKVNSAAFVWYLSATPAAAIINMSQPILFGVPVLGAKLGGMAKASNALLAASADLMRGKGTISHGKLTSDEKKAIEAMYKSGAIDRTMAMEIAGIGDSGVEYAPLRHAVMEKISWMFHRTEVVNREVVALAAYRMARAQGQTHDRAVDTAHELNFTINYDYANSSRPRILQSDFAKIAGVFMSYQLNVWYRIFRDIHQAFSGDTPKARKEARYQLAGLMAMQTLMGGTSGFFMYNVLMALAGLFFDDEDDPFSFKHEAERAIYDLFGKNVGGMIINGAPGHLTGIDLTSRIGMADFFLRMPESSKEGKDWWLEFVAGSLGASVGAVGNAVVGAHYISEGDTARGLELMAPKAVKDLMKSWRYANDGLLTRKGDVILPRDDINAWNLVSQATGFTPAKIATAHELRGRKYEAQNRIKTERSTLINRFVTAIQNGDIEARKRIVKQIAAWNKRSYAKTLPITRETLERSLMTRKRLSARREDGFLPINEKIGAYLSARTPENPYR